MTIDPDTTEIMSLTEWFDSIMHGYYNEFDGSGRWCKKVGDKDFVYLKDYVWPNIWDDVFTDSAPSEATHVAWFNK